MTLRTKETEAKYQDYLETVNKNYCFFCANKPTTKVKAKNDLWIHNYHHFYVIPNDYPYDEKYATHHILVLKRHTDKLRDEEKIELQFRIRQLQDSYDQVVYNCPKKQSVKDHFHLHLLTFIK